VEGWSPYWSTRHVGHFWPILPAPGDCEYGIFGGIKIGWGNQSTRRNRAPASLCPPQIPLDQTRARTQTTAVGSHRLTAWAMARPWPGGLTELLTKVNERNNVGCNSTSNHKDGKVVHRRWPYCCVYKLPKKALGYPSYSGGDTTKYKMVFH
jgi:hypothetical protein